MTKHAHSCRFPVLSKHRKTSLEASNENSKINVKPKIKTDLHETFKWHSLDLKLKIVTSQHKAHLSHKLFLMPSSFPDIMFFKAICIHQVVL